MSGHNLPYTGQEVRISPFYTQLDHTRTYIVSRVRKCERRGDGWNPNPCRYLVNLDACSFEVPIEVLFPVDNA